MLTGSTSGDGIKIEAGGTVVVGSGTSPTKFISGSGLNATTKTTYITSDNDIKFETNLGDIYDNRREFTMKANGQMIIPSHLNLGGKLKMTTSNGSWEIGVSADSKSLSMSYFKGSSTTVSKRYNLGSDKNENDSVLTLNMAFPVGAVYITFNNNNPGNFLGGTWIQFGQGRTLMGVGSYTDSKGITGEYAEGTSAGTYNPIYDIGVTGSVFGGIGGADNYKARILAVKADMENKDTYIKGLNIYGYDKTTPYVTVYFWRRTA